MHSFIQFNLPLARSYSNGLKVLETSLVNSGLIIATYSDSRRIVVLNDNLEVVWEREADMQYGNYVYPRVALRADGQMYATSDINNIQFFAADGSLLHEFPHEEWYSFLGTDCYFSGQYALFVTPAPGGDKLVLVNTENFQIIQEYVIDGYQEFSYDFHATPAADKILMDLSAGQDDTRLFSIQLSDQLTVTELTMCNDEIFGSFAPSGKEFSTAPHYDEGIKIFSFPSPSLIAAITQEDLFEGRNEYPAASEDTLEYRVLYLNDEVLLTITRFGRLLLIRRDTMTCFGELLLEGCQLTGYNMRGAAVKEGEEIEDYEGSVGDVKLLSDNKILVTHRDGSLRLYSIEGVNYH
jgi:hypothetical protein